MEIESVEFGRVYFGYYAKGEPVFSLTPEEVNIFVNRTDDEAYLRVEKKLQVASVEFYEKTVRLIDPVCTWEVDPRQFLPEGPYVCAMPKGKAKDKTNQDAMTIYLRNRCSWLRSVRIFMAIHPMEKLSAVTESMISFELEDGASVSVKRDAILVIEDGRPQLGI